MRSRCVLFLALAFAAVAIVPARIHPLHAQAAEPVTLTGVVSSADEGHMEGVLVSAKKTAAGATVTITVVTDKDGRYRFPASRLDPAQYALRVRAAGYDLVAPPGGVTVRLTGKPMTLLTSGADRIIGWRFSEGGPMGRPPIQLGIGNGRIVRRVAVDPTQPRVAAGYDDGHVTLSSLVDDEMIDAPVDTRGSVEALAWSNSGARFAAGTHYGQITVYET